MFDGEAFGQQMVEIVRGYVATELEPIKAENAALRRELEELKTRELPEPVKGDPGQDCDMAAVEQMLRDMVGAAVKAIPVPEDGKDGAGLADALIDSEGCLVLTMTDGRTKSLGRVNGKDGEDGKPGADGLGFDDLNVEQVGERTVRFLLKRGDAEAEFDLTIPVPIYRGVWEEKGAYEAGDIATWAGSAWHCDEPKGLKPGDPESGWRMMVKKGRDAK